MAYDDVPNSDPRGPWCPKCGLPILEHDQSILIHAPDQRSMTRWHAECARPLWDMITPTAIRVGWVRFEDPSMGS